MAEHIDDTKSFTITLKVASTPVITPTTTTTLQWIADNYDVNGSRYIDTTEMQKAVNDHTYRRITIEQRAAIVHAWQNDTLLPIKTTTTPTPQPKVLQAKGELTNVSYPPSATTGQNVTISCRVKNSGGERGTFRIDLTGGVKSMRTSTFYVYAGQTSPTKSMSVQTPSSGTSVTYTLKCIRIT